MALAQSQMATEYIRFGNQVIAVENNPAAARNGYAYQRTITIDHTKVPNSDQANFPVLVSFSDPTLATTANGGHVANSSGYDLLFTSDSVCSSKLNWEIESWSGVNGSLVAWVQIPILSHTIDTTIYMCYGEPAITTDQSNRTAVWTNRFVMVDHFEETLTSAGQTVHDSTPYGNNGSTVGTWSSGQQIAGKIGGSLNFVGSSDYSSDDYLNVPASTSLAIAASLTGSFWLRTAALNGNLQSRLVAQDSWPSTGWALFDNGPYSTNFMFRAEPGGGGGGCGTGNACTPRTVVNDNQWHLIAGVYDSAVSLLYLYVDGTLRNTVSSGGYTPASVTLNIGQIVGTSMSGQMDEVRIAGAARSADWILTEYYNQKCSEVPR